MHRGRSNGAEISDEDLDKDIVAMGQLLTDVNERGKSEQQSLIKLMLLRAKHVISVVQE